MLVRQTAREDFVLRRTRQHFSLRAFCIASQASSCQCSASYALPFST